MEKIKQLKKRIIEENFFRPKWYSVFLNPYFINRYSIYSAIKDFADNTNENVKILDVGCGLKPYRHLFIAKEYIGIDIQGGGHTDEAKIVNAYYDGLHIPYPDKSYDVVICTQVLEHATDPEILLKEITRVLKPQGKIFLSMPFIYPEHEIPFDFRRFTSFEHKRNLEKNGFEEIKIYKTTGFFGTFGQLFVIFIFESIGFKASIFKTLLSIILFAPIQIISIGLDKIFMKSGPTMDYTVTAVKNK